MIDLSTTEGLRAAGYVEIKPGQWHRPKFLPPVVNEPETINVPVNAEGKLHEQIMDWCDTQWPRVKYIHARMDQRSCIAVGAQDFTLFLPNGRTLCVECKAKSKKLEPDQRNWHKEMAMVGHKVHTVWSFEDFKSLLNK